MQNKKSSKEWEEAKTLIPEPITPLYSSGWLNDCCEHLYQPGSHLLKIVEKINTELASKLESHVAFSSSSQRKQCIYELVGLRFATDHFSDVQHYDTTVLEKLFVDEKEALLEECQALITATASRVKESLGYNQHLTRYSSETPLGSFLKESGMIFHEGVERQLREGKKMKIRISNKEKSNKTFSFDGSGEEIWESRTDVLAQALIEVTYHEPERNIDLLRTFRELQLTLPAPISNLLKKQFLFQKEKRVSGGSSLKTVEKRWREDFIKRIHQNTSALKIDRAIRSPLWQQIDKAVIGVYSRIPSLVQYDTDEHQMEATRALNILQVYDKTFDPILVFWLLPIQISFKSSIQSTDAHVLELAMYLDLVNRHCVPSIEDVFSMAEQVVNTWNDWDRNLFSRVQDALSKNVWIDVKDFPNQILHIDTSQANKLGVRMKGRSRNDIPKECLEVFVDSRIFIRKWIVEGFAGILNHNAIVYVWDQLFFGEWNSQAICDVCLAIVFLLTSRFSKATNYFGIRKVFVLDPSHLLTADIRKAYLHVQRGNSFDDIPKMNRQALTKET